MRAILAQLNEEVPGLSMSYEDLANNVPGATEAILALAEAEAKRRQYDEKNTQLIEKIKKRTELTENLRKAEQNQADAYQDYLDAAKAYNEFVEKHKSTLNTTTNAKKLGSLMADVNNAAAQYKEFTADIEEANKAIGDNEKAIEQTAEEMANISGKTLESAESYATLGELLDGTQAQLENLATAYTEVYTSAYASFTGQFGLFDQAKADMEATVSSAQKALDSQLSFWQNYAENISVLRSVSAEDLGVTQENYNEIMAYAQSGTEEAAGFAASLRQAVDSGNTEAITKLANTVGEVKAARELASGEVAAWQIDFDGKMQEIISTMETSLQEMDMSEEAIEAAKSTMTAYADEISEQGATAVANAISIANQIRTALQSASTNINIGVTGGTSGNGYAMGTDSATPGWHLVGENGPEIVYFGGGETVYNAAETAKLLNSAQEEMQIVSFLPLMQTYFEATKRYNAVQYADPLVAKSSNSGSYHISIAPQLIIEGGGTDDIESRFQEFSDIVVGNVFDALEEAGIDAKRGAYV